MSVPVPRLGAVPDRHHARGDRVGRRARGPRDAPRPHPADPCAARADQPGGGDRSGDGEPGDRERPVVGACGRPRSPGLEHGDGARRELLRGTGEDLVPDAQLPHEIRTGPGCGRRGSPSGATPGGRRRPAAALARSPRRRAAHRRISTPAQRSSNPLRARAQVGLRAVRGRDVGHRCAVGGPGHVVADPGPDAGRITAAACVERTIMVGDAGRVVALRVSHEHEPMRDRRLRRSRSGSLRVDTAVDVDDLAGGGREPVRERVRCTPGPQAPDRRGPRSAALGSTRPRGTPRSRGCSSPRPCGSGPAAMRFTRMPSGPRSRARYREVLSKAALATPIQSYLGQATVASKSSPTTDEPRPMQRPGGDGEGLQRVRRHLHRGGDVGPLGVQEVAAEGGLRRVADRVQDAVEAVDVLADATGEGGEVVGVRDVELDDGRQATAVGRPCAWSGP